MSQRCGASRSNCKSMPTKAASLGYFTMAVHGTDGLGSPFVSDFASSACPGHVLSESWACPGHVRDMPRTQKGHAQDIVMKACGASKPAFKPAATRTRGHSLGLPWTILTALRHEGPTWATNHLDHDKPGGRNSVLVPKLPRYIGRHRHR